MKGKNHLIAGAVTTTCITASAFIEGTHEIVPIAVMASMTMLGSMFPDIDTRTSKISKKAKVTSLVISKLFGHRGLMHSPILAAVVYLLCTSFLSTSPYACVYIGFLAGVLTHLACDIMTKGGIPIFYPWDRVRFSVGIFPSGSKLEFIFLIFVSVAIVGLSIFMMCKGIWISTFILS